MTRQNAATPELAARVLAFTDRAAALPDVKAAVEANHDDNRWWPLTVADPRLRMAVAGWSSRVSYAMVDTYARVVQRANRVGFDRLAGMGDAELGRLLHPLGLTAARVGYLRSLAGFLDKHDPTELLAGDPDTLIDRFAGQVRFASYKVAQCAVLYARGYHSGVIPVDSGMVTKLAPLLGLDLPTRPIAHERMRHALEACVRGDAPAYRQLVDQHGHAVTIPPDVAPSWWLHLVLIYFKRLYLNRPQPRLCQRRPVCPVVLDCPHTTT